MENSFVCKTSQLKNWFVFLVSLFFIFLVFYFKEIILFLVDEALYLLSGYIDIPEFNLEMVFYIIIGVILIRPVWKFLVVKNTLYIFEDERIMMYSGVINKEVDNIEYYRVKDYKITQPLIARMMNTHNMLLLSTDRTHPVVDFKYITNFKDREPDFRQRIIKSTSSGRGREVDVV